MVRVSHGSTEDTGNQFVSEAAKFIGTPYVWGGDAPGGFDCSGLVYYAAQKVGVQNFPRDSEEQWAAVDRISQSQLQPGDLIFEQWPGEASPGHVAIYAGGGQIIQAPAPGQDVQKVKWSPNIVHAEGGQIVGYGRVPGLSYSGEAATAAAGSGQPAEATLTAAEGSSLIGGAGSLLHGSAVVLDRFFAMFAPGQGWRLAFGVAAVVLLFMSFRAFTAGGVPVG